MYGPAFEADARKAHGAAITVATAAASSGAAAAAASNAVAAVAPNLAVAETPALLILLHRARPAAAYSNRISGYNPD